MAIVLSMVKFFQLVALLLPPTNAIFALVPAIFKSNALPKIVLKNNCFLPRKFHLYLGDLFDPLSAGKHFARVC